MKILLTFLLIFTLNNFIHSQDSIPKNNDVKVLKLEKEISKLEYKIETLENSTDRILNALYFTIGIVLTFFIGLNLWNYFVQNRKYSKKLKAELKDKEKHLEEKIKDRLDNAYKTIDSSIENKSKSIKSDIMELKLLNYHSKSKYIDYESAIDELEYIKKFIETSMEYHNLWKFGGFKVKTGLIALQDYLEKDEYVYHSKSDELIKYLSSEKFDEFKNYTKKIIKLLEAK
jgi:hypothetical protein